MSTQVTEGSLLVWMIAAREAQYARHEYIEVGHLFIGLCKAPEVVEQAVEAEALRTAQEARLELEATERVFERLTLDRAELRRTMREQLGFGEASGHRQVMHRSDASRAVFARAAELATEQALPGPQPIDLLCAICEAEDEAVVDVLQDHGVTVERFAQAAEEVASEPRPEVGRPETGDGPGAGTPLLNRYGRDLTQLAREERLDPVIGRREEMRRIARILARKRKNNPILIGDAGVGKTCVVEGLAQITLHEGAAPSLRERRIVEVSTSAMVAGTRYRGEFEERMRGVIEEASANPEVIVFIDEIHTIIGGGSAPGGLDAANILKPALARGDIRCIGATTIAEYRRHIERDAALQRRFEQVLIDEPSAEQAAEILHGVRASFQDHHGVEITDEAIEAAVELSVRHVADRRLPDKAVDLIDQACARARIGTVILADVTAEPQQAPFAAIEADDIAAVVSELTGVPVGRLAREDACRLVDMEEEIGRRVVGQPEAVSEVCRAIRTAKAGLKPPNRPVGLFMFMGSTGTGKTETAKALAEFLFGNEERLIRFDMSEYGERHSVARLLGAPPGYVGYEEEGQLSVQVRTHPYSVVLFDEIEKAHPEVLDIFLQIFDEGCITDAQGRRIDFSETIVILTSNLGSEAAGGRGGRIGIAVGDESSDEGAAPERSAKQREYAERVEAAVAAGLRPELFNRIQRNVVFFPLEREAVRRIIDKFIDRVNQRLGERQLELDLTDAAYEALMEQGYSEEYGAREMERTIGRLIEEPVGEQIISGALSGGEQIRVDVEDGEITFGR